MSRGLFRSLTEKQPANTDYIRYWHGTAGLIRLFHLFTDVQGIRNFGMLAVMLLAALVVWMLYRRGHWDLALCLLLSMVSVQLGNLRLSMEYLPCFVIAFAMCAVFLIREERSERSLPRLSVVAGVLTAYFDFLTTETVTILLPLILVISVRAKERRLRDRRRTVRLILRCLFWWAAAYAGAFAVKWWAASLVTGENQFLAALSAAGNRVSGNFRELEEGKSPNAWRSIMANLSVLFGAKKRIDYGKILLGLVLSGGAGYYLFRNHRRKRLCVHGPEFLLLLGAVVLIRYGVLANHAYLHSFFTYRALICPVMAVLVSLRLNLRLDGRGGQ